MEIALHIYAAEFGRPNVNPPDIVIQDNIELLAFAVDTDRAFFSWDIPYNYAGGDLSIQVEWTNDGGVDDNGLDVKVQLDYQTVGVGDAVSGNHVNSPKTIEDTYTSNSGWIFHLTALMTIAEADFTGKHGIYIKLSFVTPTGGALTSDPHLIGIQLIYTAYINK